MAPHMTKGKEITTATKKAENEVCKLGQPSEHKKGKKKGKGKAPLEGRKMRLEAVKGKEHLRESKPRRTAEKAGGAKPNGNTQENKGSTRWGVSTERKKTCVLQNTRGTNREGKHSPNGQRKKENKMSNREETFGWKKQQALSLGKISKC